MPTKAHRIAVVATPELWHAIARVSMYTALPAASVCRLVLDEAIPGLHALADLLQAKTEGDREEAVKWFSATISERGKQVEAMLHELGEGGRGD